MNQSPMVDLLTAARRRTRWAVAAVLAGVFVTVVSSAIHEVFNVGLGTRIALTVVGILGLVVVAVAVVALVHWVNERSANLHLTLSTSNAVLWRLDAATWRLEFVAGDPGVVGVTERTVTDLETLRPLADPADVVSGLDGFRQAIARGEAFNFSYRARLPSRGLRQIAVSALPLATRGGAPLVLGVAWDETETRAAALRAERTSRLYATLSAISRVTRAAENVDRLYDQVTHAAVEAGQFTLAAVLGEDPGSDHLDLLAVAGPAAYVEDGARGRALAAEALARGEPVWASEVQGHEGVGAALAVPIRRPGGWRGALVLGARDAGFFSAAERTLMGRIGDDLTTAAERVVGREEQRRQRELLTALVASVPVPIIGLDRQGRVRDLWNAAAEETFGWTREEVVGKALPFVPIESADDSASLIRRVLGGEVVRNVRLRRQRKDGQVLDLELAAAPLHGARGEVTGILGVMTDVTDRLVAERRLHASEARFRELSEHAVDVVYRYRLQPTPRLEYVNPAIELVLGYTPDELYAMDDALTTILHPEHAELFQSILRDPEQVEDERVVLRWLHREGRTVWVEHRGALVREGDTVVALEGIARDVTERRQFEEQLARLSRVVEQTHDSVIVTDPAGIIVYVNPAFEAMTGWTAAEAVGRKPSILKSGLQSETLYADMWARLTAGHTYSGRFTNRRKDASYYLADVVISPVRDPSGTVVNYVGIQRDVTRQRDLEDQLRQSQKMEALGQLTGGIAHDFNNLLTVILSNAALLVDALADRPDLQHDVNAIRAAAGRGARVVRQLMQFGRRDRIEPQPIDLGAAVREIVSTFRRVFPENIDVRVDVEAGLPPAMADPTAVEQMLLNLATNARDAMPMGGDLRFSVRRRAGGEDDLTSDWVVVSVRDSGEGMSREVIGRIFEPFYTTKPAGKGTGLGLAMVYGLMEQQGGRVTVYSEPGLGTTMRLVFPAARGGVVAPADAGSDPIPRGRGERVLLVEDEPGLRDVGARILETLGYRVETAADGAAALERLATTTFDAVITDVVMPGMTGPQLARAVRERGLTLPILFATGYAAKDVLAEIGEDVLLVEKPWTLEELARRVARALNSG